MPTPCSIVGRNGDKAHVTRAGQLITAPFAYDETKFNELAEPNTAYNFYEAVAGQQFVITGMRLKADRNVSNTVDATVIVYESDNPDSITVDKVLHQEALIRGESIGMFPINILVRKGKFVNAKTDDDDIYVTIMGYYIPEI